MRRLTVLMAGGIFLLLMVTVWWGKVSPAGMRAYLPSVFTSSQATTRTFRRRTGRIVPSQVPCASRQTEAKCLENSAGTPCYWEVKSKRCTTSIPGCTDGDGGLDFYRRTTAYGRSDQWSTLADSNEDMCGTNGQERGKLKEYYCDSSGFVAVQLFTCPQGCGSGSCSLAYADRTSGKFPAMQQPLLIWPAGRPTVDPISVTSFENEISVLSRYAMLLQRIAPDTTACKGECTFTVTVTDRVSGVIAKATRRTTSDADLTAQFPLPVRLEANRTYVFTHVLTSASSVTLRAGAEDPSAQSRMRVQVLSSKIDGKDRTDGAGMAFTLQGSFAE